MMKKSFPCIELDDTNQKMTILLGDLCSIPYKMIEKVSILNQQASFKGEEKPFTHQVMEGTAFLCAIMEPRFYVGLKIDLKDGTCRAVYISERKTGFNTFIYNEDKKEAETIKTMIEKRIFNNKS